MPVIQWGQRYIGWELSELTGLKPRTLHFPNDEARTIAIALDEVHWLGKKRKLDLIKIRVMYAAGAGTGGRR